MRRFPRAIKAYVMTRFMRSTFGVWMPNLWKDAECRKEDLPKSFWETVEPHHEDFERLGFTTCRYSKAPRSLTPMARYSAGINYLDRSQRYLGYLVCSRMYNRKAGREVYGLAFAFTAVFDHGSLSCSNGKLELVPPSENVIIRVKFRSVHEVHQHFLSSLEERKEAPRRFADSESLRQWFDARQIEKVQEGVDRGLFIPMTDEEVAFAKALLKGGDEGW